MKVKFHKNALKNLEKLNSKTKEKIRTKIKELISCYDGSGIIPFNQMQIKKLEGKWIGFFRMRIGKIRLIYRIDKELLEIQIYEIDNRGDVYK